MPNQEGPELTLDRALWYGRTYRAHSASIAEETSQQYSKKQSEWWNKKPPIFCRLQKGGLMQAASWETDGQSLGEYSMHSFGESPSVAAESRLSQILEANAHPKYYLSAKACQGILNRANLRGKELPEMLRIALENQACIACKETESTEQTPQDATEEDGQTGVATL